MITRTDPMIKRLRITLKTMKHDRYSSKPAGRPAKKLIGGMMLLTCPLGIV